MSQNITIRVIRPHERDRDFLADIAPFFLSSAVRKEMPYLDDRADKTWFFALREDEIVGIAGTFVEKGEVYLTSLYVVPSARGTGVGASLVEARFAAHQDLPVRTMANPAAAPFYLRRGFEPLYRRGRYQMLRREAR